TRHQLIARNSVKYAVHDRPLRRRHAPPALGFGLRQFHGAGAAEIHLQLTALHEHAAPYDFARLADALQAPSAQPEVHRRLPLADRARVTAHQVGRGHGPGDLEDPDEFLAAVYLVRFAVAHVVQSGLRRVAQRAPDA